MDSNPTPSVPEPPAPSQGQGQVRATIRGRRFVPQGALPRQLQTWVMVGLAVLILGVILMTGRPEPARPVQMPSAAPTAGPIAPARVQSYQDRLAEQEARLLRDIPASVPTLGPVDVPVTLPPTPVDPAVDERQRRDEQSLFADNVAFTRRINASTEQASGSQQTQSPKEPASSERAAVTRAPDTTDVRSTSTSQAAAGRIETSPRETLTEGTVIETVLVNRLDGTFQGPVDCVVTTPVFSRDRQLVVIPAGARVLGTATAVQSWGESRLAVKFHRLLLPDGRAHRLDSYPGLNQVGETGLKDSVDRHYLQVFGASLAIGAIAGLAQVGTRGGFDPSFGDAARQSAGGSLATSSARVLDRYLNVLPTVTIHEGHRIKVVLTGDLQLPAYGPLAAQGGL